jgi:hypothetical protein
MKSKSNLFGMSIFRSSEKQLEKKVKAATPISPRCYLDIRFLDDIKFITWFLSM